MRTARAFDFSILVISGKIVRGVGLDHNQLVEPGVVNAGSIERNQQGAPSGMKIAGVEGQSNSTLFLILPVEACVDYIEIEHGIDDQIAPRRQIKCKSKPGRSLLPHQRG